MLSEVMVVEQVDGRGRRRCRYPASGSSGSKRRVVEGASARSALAMAHCTHFRMAAGVNGGKAKEDPIQRDEYGLGVEPKRQSAARIEEKYCEQVLRGAVRGVAKRKHVVEKVEKELSAGGAQCALGSDGGVLCFLGE
jgi:hypothetical protein